MKSSNIAHMLYQKLPSTFDCSCFISFLLGSLDDDTSCFYVVFFFLLIKFKFQQLLNKIENGLNGIAMTWKLIKTIGIFGYLKDEWTHFNEMEALNFLFCFVVLFMLKSECLKTKKKIFISPQESHSRHIWSGYLKQSISRIKKNFIIELKKKEKININIKRILMTHLLAIEMMIAIITIKWTKRHQIKTKKKFKIKTHKIII